MASRTPPRRLAAFLIVGLITASALYFGSVTHGAKASSAAVLDFPRASCASATSVSFTWQAADGASEVWLDIETDDLGFSPGAYQGSGPFTGGTTSYTLNSLKANTPYIARINSRTPAGWVSSDSVAFVPCGAPQLINYTSSCSGEAATASFRWAPASPAVLGQTVEAGPDQGFSPDKTRSSGPLLPLVNKFDLSGLRANVTNYFRISATMADGSSNHSIVNSFTTTCAGAFSNTTTDELVHTNDTLVYKRLNINAPVNERKVGYDGVMGVPEGKDDVVLYDFSAYRNIGGTPGHGTSIIAGHLDYHPNFEAVFWNLAKAQPGDVIDYYGGDGSHLSFQVAWVSLIPSDEPLNQYFVSTDPATLMLITCEGNFDRTVGNYDKRALVYAIEIAN